MTKESIPQLPCRRFHADTFFRRLLRHVFAVDVKFQTMLARQARDEFLIRIRFRSAQLVIEMNDRKDDAQFMLATPAANADSATESIPPETATPTRSPAEAIRAAEYGRARAAPANAREHGTARSNSRPAVRICPTRREEGELALARTAETAVPT